MPELVDVAIQKALVDRVRTFAAARSPAIDVDLPNVVFTPPTPESGVHYLRVRFLPADPVPISVQDDSTEQHVGLLQVDVVHVQGDGEYAPGRVVADLIAYFRRGTEVTNSGFTSRIIRRPARGPMIKDDPWVFIPVRMAYWCFARDSG